MNKSDREKVFNKYNGKCAYCGCELVKGWHVDHKDPIRRLSEYNSDKRRFVNNGNSMYPERDCMDNYMPACASCNINKHSSDLDGFRTWIGKMKSTLSRG